MSQHGELIDENTVRFERLLAGPIERVWEYLVDADKRAQWLCGGATELKVGGHVELLFHNATLSGQKDIERPEKYKDLPEKVTFSGTVTRCEPPHVIAHSWDFEDTSSEVCYELQQHDGKVLLILTHTRLGGRDEVHGVCGGWHTHLDILIDVLNGTEPKPFWQVHTQMEAEYAAILKPEA